MGRREYRSPPGHAIDEGQIASLRQERVACVCPILVDRVCENCVCCKGMAGLDAGTRKAQPRVKSGVPDFCGLGKMPHYNVNLSNKGGFQEQSVARP